MERMAQTANAARMRIAIRGAVQGVGFRPFLYRLATSMGLAGWVQNSSQGLFIEVEGARDRLDAFLLRIEPEKPPRSFIQSLEASFLDPVGFASFEIRESGAMGTKTALVLPDIAVCADCLADISDPDNRRHRYPFTNCTNCGPRFSILESLPYDRANTTMKTFAMCEECRAEYADPLDRRFHAQPNACAQCGPHLELRSREGARLATREQALLEAAAAIRAGAIVAVKGIGGFHLLADARNEQAIARLRARKHREEKPFAVMAPSLDAAKAFCAVSALEERLLVSPEAPIVLLRRKSRHSTLNLELPSSIAPGNPYLGVMLPSNPLHYLLLGELQFPVVATSGNLSDEPICIDDGEALDRLNGVADFFLGHNRPIIRHVDDSIVRVMAGREMVLRRARGYAPLPLHLAQALPPMLATGGHLKNTIAVSVGCDVFISQHIGDLETARAFEAFEQVIYTFKHLYEVEPEAIACDAHPDYLSTQFARMSALPTHSVQHHYAHIRACMADNELAPPLLGVAWDGTGIGPDGTIWGGEFLRVTAEGFARVAHFRTFRLPGGDQAMREPRRSALGLLYEMIGEEAFAMNAPAFTDAERNLLRQMLQKGIHSPQTSSAGRLFDAVASLCDLRQTTRFEGQGAVELEFAVAEGVDESYPLQLHERDAILIVDWEPMIRGLLADRRAGVPTGKISARFHNAMVDAIVEIARRLNEEKIALSGGCFQNQYLTERAVRQLQRHGFRPYWHQRIPPNDGGLCVGQLLAAADFAASAAQRAAKPQPKK